MPQTKDSPFRYFALDYGAVFREKHLRTELWRGGQWVKAPSMLMYIIRGEVGATEVDAEEAMRRCQRWTF